MTGRGCRCGAGGTGLKLLMADSLADSVPHFNPGKPVSRHIIWTSRRLSQPLYSTVQSATACQHPITNGRWQWPSHGGHGPSFPLGYVRGWQRSPAGSIVDKPLHVVQLLWLFSFVQNRLLVEVKTKCISFLRNMLDSFLAFFHHSRSKEPWSDPLAQVLTRKAAQTLGCWAGPLIVACCFLWT